MRTSQISGQERDSAPCGVHQSILHNVLWQGRSLDRNSIQETAGATLGLGCCSRIKCYGLAADTEREESVAPCIRHVSADRADQRVWSSRRQA